MNHWKCPTCSYVYKPEKGDWLSDVEKGTPFEALDKYWKCPTCGQIKDFLRRLSMNEKVVQAITEQVNKELYSAYLYMAMEQYLEDQDMSGMASWMYQQALEERFHARKMMKYLNSRGQKVVLKQIDEPKVEWASVKEVFDDVLEHEQFVTSSINAIQGIAVEVKDYATMNFLQWFIDEQIEEEEAATDLIKQLKLIGDNGYGLLMLDKEMAQRTFTEPAPAE